MIFSHISGEMALGATRTIKTAGIYIYITKSRSSRRCKCMNLRMYLNLRTKAVRCWKTKICVDSLKTKFYARDSIKFDVMFLFERRTAFFLLIKTHMLYYCCAINRLRSCEYYFLTVFKQFWLWSSWRDDWMLLQTVPLVFPMKRWWS